MINFTSVEELKELVVKLLIEKKAENISVIDVSDKTTLTTYMILSEAIKTGVLDIYTLISSNIPDVNILINKTSVKDAIKYAVQNGDIPIISKLIEYENAKQNMNLVDALHNEKSEMAEFLIEKIDTLDYTITDHRGYSLLHLALEKIQNLSDRYYIINLLLNGNANVNAIGPNEDPVIYTAALIGDYNCFSLLKTKGAYFDVNNVLTSPILYAATIGHNQQIFSEVIATADFLDYKTLKNLFKTLNTQRDIEFLSSQIPIVQNYNLNNILPLTKSEIYQPEKNINQKKLVQPSLSSSDNISEEKNNIIDNVSIMKSEIYQPDEINNWNALMIPQNISKISFVKKNNVKSIVTLKSFSEFSEAPIQSWLEIKKQNESEEAKNENSYILNPLSISLTEKITIPLNFKKTNISEIKNIEKDNDSWNIYTEEEKQNESEEAKNENSYILNPSSISSTEKITTPLKLKKINSFEIKNIEQNIKTATFLKIEDGIQNNQSNDLDILEDNKQNIKMFTLNAIPSFSSLFEKSKNDNQSSLDNNENNIKQSNAEEEKQNELENFSIAQINKASNSSEILIKNKEIANNEQNIAILNNDNIENEKDISNQDSSWNILNNNTKQNIKTSALVLSSFSSLFQNPKNDNQDIGQNNLDDNSWNLLESSSVSIIGNVEQ